MSISKYTLSKERSKKKKKKKKNANEHSQRTTILI